MPQLRCDSLHRTRADDSEPDRTFASSPKFCIIAWYFPVMQPHRRRAPVFSLVPLQPHQVEQSRMKPTCLETVAALRLIVGYLGERAQHNWWKSSFFAQGSDSFLVPLFPKTTYLARVAGVTAAAGAVHDAQVGEGNAYHLFRLPEEHEYALHHFYLTIGTSEQPIGLPTAPQDALKNLHSMASEDRLESIGPFRVGSTSATQEVKSWSQVAAAYAFGFQQGKPVLPYFSDVL